jgi:hypothetical protein
MLTLICAMGRKIFMFPNPFSGLLIVLPRENGPHPRTHPGNDEGKELAVEMTGRTCREDAVSGQGKPRPRATCYPEATLQEEIVTIS